MEAVTGQPLRSEILKLAQKIVDLCGEESGALRSTKHCAKLIVRDHELVPCRLVRHALH